MDRIFIQIASYRDVELPKTISSALANADKPERLRFGICWQYDETTLDDLDQYLPDERFRIAQYFYEDSRGCCWARHQTNILYHGEEYTLQIDAHTRFSPDWDTRFIRMLSDLPADKPLLSTYPAPWDIEDGKAVLKTDRGIQKLTLSKIRKDLTTVFKTVPVMDSTHCARSHFIGAGQIFTHGAFCLDVEYDPELYYLGEEISISARAYTHGYDFFCPKYDLIWHRYKHKMRGHWADHKSTLQAKSLARLKTLFLGDHETLGKYGLGARRSLKEYETFTGINFAECASRSATPIHFNRTIRLDPAQIDDRTDYDFWIFTLRNTDDEEIYRHDIYDEAILSKRLLQIQVNEQLPDVPTSFMIWPHVKDGGFLAQNFHDL